MPKRYCAHPGCNEKVRGSYCPTHQPEAGGHISRALRGEKPWSFFYQTQEWARTKVIVRTRDGYQCMAIEHGLRCPRFGRVPGQPRGMGGGSILYVHHQWPLRVIWQAVDGDRDRFMRIALDTSRLTTLCAHHHRMADVNTKGLDESAIIRRLARA
jgi:hypothetical protein